MNLRYSSLFLSLIITVLPGLLFAAQGVLPGNGTADNPYLIEDIQDFNVFSTDYKYRTEATHTSLTCNLDLSLNGNYTDCPIRSTSLPASDFNGILDGNNHTISNLNIISTKIMDLSLFEIIGPNGKVVNLTLNNTTIHGSQIAPLAYINYGEIINCHVTANLQCNYYSAGFVFYNYGIIKQCHTRTINNTLHNYASGFVHVNNNGTISESYADVLITSNLATAFCYSMVNNGLIHDCYSTGTIYSDEGSGFCGILGPKSTINNCYTLAKIIPATSDHINHSFLSRFNTLNISNCYYFNIIALSTSQTTCLSQEQFTNPESFIGFDFGNDTSIGIWTIDGPNNCPKLSWQNDQGPTQPTRIPINTTLQGTGYPDNPFQINNLDDFIELYSNPDLIGGYYSINTDIDLNQSNPNLQTPFNTAVIDRPFGGIIEGNHHTIKNISIQQSINPAGLFSDFYGTIKNIKIENIQIENSPSNTGGLCGTANYALIENCQVTGSITGSSTNYGGLCGYMKYSNILSSYSNCYITGLSNLGGLCGSTLGGTIRSSHSESILLGNSSIGGISGASNLSTIRRSYSHGYVKGIAYLGGFTGYNFNGWISESYANDYVSVITDPSNQYIGGFCGKAVSQNKKNIYSCYSNTKINCNSQAIHVSNFCGQNESIGMPGTENCYSYILNGPNNNSSYAMSDIEVFDPNSYVGFDFLGDPTNNDPNDDWQMIPGHLPKLVWQSDDGPILQPNTIITTLRGTGQPNHPFQINNPDDFLEFITNPSLNCGYYILNCDIDSEDLNGQNHIFDSVIINRNFGGYFNGRKHKLTNLTINANANHNGLFRSLCGTVNNLIIENLNITNSANLNERYTGGICGLLSNGNIICSNLIQCHINGNNYVGGLCGENQNGILEGSSSSDGTLSGNNYVGGLVGYNSGLISQCNSELTIYGNFSVGGICGFHHDSLIYHTFVDENGKLYIKNESNSVGALCGSIQNAILRECYATPNFENEDSNINTRSKLTDSQNSLDITTSSTVGGITGENLNSQILSSFWNIETAGITPVDENDALSARTTQEMKSPELYINAGWDFSDTDGTPAIWTMNPGEYPRLVIDAKRYPTYDMDIFADISQCWQQNIDTCPECYGVDLIKDGQINMQDLIFLAQHWLQRR